MTKEAEEYFQTVKTLSEIALQLCGIPKQQFDMRHPKPILQSIIEAYAVNRGAGYTTEMLKIMTTRTEPTYMVFINAKQANESGLTGTLSITDMELGKFRSRKGILLIDNHVITHLCEISINRIEDLEQTVSSYRDRVNKLNNQLMDLHKKLFDLQHKTKSNWFIRMYFKLFGK